MKWIWTDESRELRFTSCKRYQEKYNPRGLKINSSKAPRKLHVFKLTNYNDTKVKLSLWNGFIRMQFCCTIDGESFTTQMKQNIAMFLNDAVLSASQVFSKSLATYQMSDSSCPNVYLACSLKDCEYKIQRLALCDHRKGVVECVKTGRKTPRMHLPSSQQSMSTKNLTYLQVQHLIEQQ